MSQTPDYDKLRLYKSTLVNEGSARKAAAKLGIHPSTLSAAMKRYERYVAEGHIEDKPLFEGKIAPAQMRKLPIPEAGCVARYFFSCAQNNTPVHSNWWSNLIAFCDRLDAQLFVSTFTYNHNAYGELAVKRGTQKRQGKLWYAEEIRDYVCDEDMEVADGLVWLGGENIIPTAEKPLTGYETHAGRKSIIIPHTKIACQTVASNKFEPAKYMYTTGTVTQSNYIQKKAGRKAEHHHAYAGLLVEVTDEGNWFCWQVHADELTGSFYHLDMYVSDEEVTEGHRIEAITWGDIHRKSLREDMRALCWGMGGIMETLRPKHQFFHDVLDFRSRNHHDTRDPHLMFQKYHSGDEDVEQEIQQVAEFLYDTYRPWCKSVVVDSNHDRAFKRWLKESDYKTDPVNAVYFLKAQLRQYEAIRDEETDFHLLEWAVEDAGGADDVIFLRQDESYIVCADFGGIECGMHGDEGANGTKGTPEGLKRIGRRANIADKHAPGIHEGLYIAGMLGDLDQGYNTGPSGWSHANILTYPNGKRCISTIWNGRWRA